MSKRKTLRERFDAKVDRSGGPEACHLWMGAKDRDGYGSIGLGGRSAGHGAAHRVAWELANGPIPPGAGYHGTVVMHTCDNPGCVNPSHLRLGSQLDNVSDCRMKGRTPTGSARSSALLDETDVVLLRFLRSIGAANKAVASWFGISPQLASLVNNKTRWRHC